MQRSFLLIIHSVDVQVRLSQNVGQGYFASAEGCPDQRRGSGRVRAIDIKYIVLLQQVIHASRLIALRSHVKSVHARRSRNSKISAVIDKQIDQIDIAVECCQE